jgi:hypothetical protein
MECLTVVWRAQGPFRVETMITLGRPAQSDTTPANAVPAGPLAIAAPGQYARGAPDRSPSVTDSS